AQSRSAYGHVAGGKVRNGLAENHREVDGGCRRRVALAAGLVDCHSGRGFVDGIDLAGEIAVADSSPAEDIVSGILDRVVVGEVEADRAIASASVHGDGVSGTATAHTGDRSAGDAAGREGEIGAVHAADALAEGDRKLKTGGVGR